MLFRSLDAHPKHPVALGAALLLGTGAVIPTTSSPPAAVAVTPSVTPLPSNPDARAPVAVQSAAAHEVAAEVTTATEVVTATGDPLAPPVALSELSIASVAGVAAPKPSARFKLGAIPPAALAAVGAVAMLLFAVLVWVLTSDGGTEKTLPSSSASSSSSDLTTGSTAGTAGPTTGPTVTLPPLTMPPAAGGDAQFGRGAQRLLDALKSTPPAPSGPPARVVYVTALGTEASVEIFKKAAAEINTKLGGLAGRPIEVALCIPRAESSTLALSKADLLACSELQAAAKPVAVVQGVHPFGPESTEIFRAKGVTTIMDAAFYLPDAYPNQGVVTTSTINCLLLSAVMGDAALRAGKSRVAVIYQPVLGCGRSLKFLELSDDGWVAGLRAAGVTPVISVSQDRDRMPSEEDVARLIAAKPDAVLIHEGTICGELTKRFAKALPQAVPTIITTGCDKDRDPSVPLQYVGTDGCSSLAPGLDAEALARIKSLACSGESGALLLLWEVASEGAGMAPAVGPDRWRDVMFQGTRWFNRLRPEPLVFGAVPKYPGLGSTVQSFYATPAAAATLVELRDLFNR